MGLKIMCPRNSTRLSSRRSRETKMEWNISISEKITKKERKGRGD